MILVTGAAGTTGSEVVRQLAGKGVRVKALIRDAEKAKRFPGPGVETVVADLERPATLDKAFRGVDKIFLASSPDPRVSLLHGNAIDAAKRSGVKQIVRLSAVAASTSSPARLLKWHGEVDERLSRSGISYSILRPQFFMQNLLGMRGSIQADGAIYLPAKETKTPLIDTRDVAAAAVAVLTSEGHSGRIYDLSGPESLGFAEIAARIGKAIGRTVTYVDVPGDAAREALLSQGWPEFLADGFVEMLAYFATGAASDVTNTVEKLTGVKPRTVDAFAKDYAGIFAGTVGAEA
ncbi:MAG TPA: SDR family oxidoreductase [Candidatus Eisenbacteria bacterium]|nr:SDR family oxidoreductase [Candidatus Eisenbacteria bacterium]